MCVCMIVCMSAWDLLSVCVSTSPLCLPALFVGHGVDLTDCLSVYPVCRLSVRSVSLSVAAFVGIELRLREQIGRQGYGQRHARVALDQSV